MKSSLIPSLALFSVLSSSAFAQSNSLQFDPNARGQAGSGSLYRVSATECGTCDPSVAKVNTHTVELPDRRTLEINRLANMAIQYSMSNPGAGQVLTTTICPLGTTMTTATRGGIALPGYKDTMFAPPSAVTNVDMQCRNFRLPVFAKRGTVPPTVTTTQGLPLNHQQLNTQNLNNNAFLRPWNEPTVVPQQQTQDGSMCPVLTCRSPGTNPPAIWVARTSNGVINDLSVEAIVYQDQVFEMKFYNPAQMIWSSHLVCPDGSARYVVGSNQTDLSSVRLESGPFETNQLDRVQNRLFQTNRNAGADECQFIIRAPHSSVGRQTTKVIGFVVTLAAAIALF